MQKREKKGLSTIIVTLILILVSLVAVGIVWLVVRNIIQTGTEGVGLSQFSLSAKILDVAIDNSSNNVSLSVKRNAGEGELDGIGFVFSSNENTEVITRNVSLKELEQMKFYFHLYNTSVSDLISVSIVPLIKQDEKQISGIALDKYNLGKNQNNILGETTCSPAICGTPGYMCGLRNNGSCSGNLNCGSCGSQATCPSGTCVCNPGWSDCNNDNACECSLSSSYCVGGSCVLQTVSGNFRYVRAGATGTNNGSDWNNAYISFPTTLLRNYTYYIASGNYGSYLFNTAESETQIITIKKATMSDHGTNLGWNDNYGTGQTSFNNLIFNTGYWIFDGQIGGSLNNWISGFKVTSLDDDTHVISSTTYVSDIVLRNIEIQGFGYSQCNSSRGININANNLLVDNVFIHNFSSVGIRLSGDTNVTIQNSKLHNIASSCPEVHFEHIAVFDGVTNITIRNNIFSQEYRDNILDGGFAISYALTNGKIDVYNNVFFNINSGVYVNSDGLGSLDVFNVYGNTFVGYRVPISGGYTINSVNNIFCNLDSYFNPTYTRSAYAGDYNLYCYDSRYSYPLGTNGQVLPISIHPFLDYLSNWHLNMSTNAGISLPSPYNIDLFGNIRGADGVWDRGAYEYV